MASYQTTVSTTYIKEGSDTIINCSFSAVGGKGLTSSNPLELHPGDTLSFYHSQAMGYGSVSVALFDSSIWTSSTSLSIARSATASKTIKSSPTLDTVDTIRAAYNGRYDYFYVKVVNAAKVDPFSFISQSLLFRDTYYNSNIITVTGNSSPADFTISGTGIDRKFRVNGGSWVTSATGVNAGDTLQLRMKTPTGYNQTSNCTLTGGANNFQANWALTTEPSPDSGSTIYIGPSSGTIKLSEVKTLFGGDGKLKSYYRGGSNVPDISVNSGIPTSGTISLQDFYGSATTFYFRRRPVSKSDGGNTTSSPVSAYVSWVHNTDFDFGYSEDNNTNVEFKWVVTGDTNDVTISGGGSTYSTSNNSLSISHTSGTYVEYQLSGTVTVYARLVGTTYEQSATMNWSFWFAGP